MDAVVGTGLIAGGAVGVSVSGSALIVSFATFNPVGMGTALFGLNVSISMIHCGYQVIDETPMECSLTIFEPVIQDYIESDW